MSDHDLRIVDADVMQEFLTPTPEGEESMHIIKGKASGEPGAEATSLCGKTWVPTRYMIPGSTEYICVECRVQRLGIEIAGLRKVIKFVLDEIEPDIGGPVDSPRATLSRLIFNGLWCRFDDKGRLMFL